MVPMWRPESNLGESVLSPSPVQFLGLTEVIKLDLYPLSPYLLTSQYYRFCNFTFCTNVYEIYNAFFFLFLVAQIFSPCL